MKRELCVVLAVACVAVIAMLTPVAGDGSELRESEHAAGEGTYKRVPMPFAKREPRGPAHDAAKAESEQIASRDGRDPVDSRPLVRVYSQPAHCGKCREFERWWADHRDDSPLLFRVSRDVPDWAVSVPAFHYRDTTGKWKVIYGWHGIEATRRAVVLAADRRPNVSPGSGTAGFSPGVAAGRDNSHSVRRDRK